MTKQQLMEDNMGLVVYTIKKYYPTFMSDDDIFQTGMLGLCRAADTWDENKSAFSTYAVKCICNEIKAEFCRQRRHSGIRSLDDSCKDYDEISLKNTIVGDTDVNFVDLQSILEQFDPVETDILKYRANGMTTLEIANKLGCSRQTVSGKLRKMIRKWKEYA